MQKLYDQLNTVIGRVLALSVEDLKREDGQGATEYAMVIVFVVVGLSVTLGLLGGSIITFLNKVGTAVSTLI